MKMLKVIVASVMVYAGLIQGAQAGISLGQTRVIYPQSASARTLTLRNSGGEVYLVQAAVMDPETGRPAPGFTVLPPLFRLEGNSRNIVRISRTGGDFPQDRESVFRFRVNAIPAGKAPDPAAENGASLSVSLGISIKLFYRPDNLPVTPTEAYGRLTFRREGAEVVVNNPTPYYQTFSQLSLGGKAVDLEKYPSMVAPFGTLRYPAGGEGKVEWTMITDYGGNSDAFHATVQ